MAYFGRQQVRAYHLVRIVYCRCLSYDLDVMPIKNRACCMGREHDFVLARDIASELAERWTYCSL